MEGVRGDGARPPVSVGALFVAFALVAGPFAVAAWLLVNGREDAEVAVSLTVAVTVVTALGRKGSHGIAVVRLMVLAVVSVTAAMFAFKDVADGVTHSVLDRVSMHASAQALQVDGSTEVTVHSPWSRPRLSIVFALAEPAGQQPCARPEQNRLRVSLESPGQLRVIAADALPGHRLSVDLPARPTDVRLVVTLRNSQDSTCRADLSVTEAAVSA